MKTDFANIINELNERSLFIKAFNDGWTSEDFKASILATFKPYFRHDDHLKKDASAFLVNTWIAYALVQNKKPNKLKSIGDLVDFLNTALSVNREGTLKSLALWRPELNQSLTRFWSIKNLSHDLTSLNLEDFHEQAMNLIGQSIEGLLKPFLKMFIEVKRITERLETDTQSVLNADLGVIISELLLVTEFQRLLTVVPADIKLNSWRNIAYHHNSRVNDGRILCNYKKGNGRIEFTVSRWQLQNVVKKVFEIFNVVKIADTIIVFDNLDDIRRLSTSMNGEKLRDEALFIDLYSAISVQGFKIVNLAITKNSAVLTLQELTTEDATKRLITSSKFLFDLWYLVKRQNISIKYLRIDGHPHGTSEVKGSTCVALQRQAIKYDEHASNISYHFTANDELNIKIKKLDRLRRKGINPFLVSSFAEEVTNHTTRFLSQQGQEISAVEFVQKFTLNIFNNYLVLRLKGYQPNEIHVSVGNDGSLQYVEGSKPKLLRIPATIEDVVIQREILRYTELCVKLFEEKKLSLAVINKSKLENNFSRKMGLKELERG